MAEGRGRFRLGVDVGGTHTDLVLLDTDTGEVTVEKVSSTPHNPALGVLDGVGRFLARGIAPGDISYFAHGTTITTNALLEMRGAKVGLLITKGYRAVQEVQSQARDGNLFDYFFRKPEPIAPQSRTHEIAERTDYQGNVLLPIAEDDVRRAARALKAAGVESVAVSYLFSFMNPAHEQATRRILEAELPGISVSLSSDVLPRVREWARLSTTLLNAYLEPVMVRYIRHLGHGLDEAGVITRQRFLMQSNGGVMPFSAVVSGAKTVHTLFSGPAAGAQAAAYLAEHDAQTGLVTLDMGGTSADIAFIEGGLPLETTEGEIARRQIDVPALDMTTISAGGGSIAGIDGGGFLTVGPRSAGADPGPACYGRGGGQPTVTDADVVCGFLNPDYFLGGKQKLDVAASRAVVEKHVAGPLKMSVLEAAEGIRRIVDMRMADEVRVFAAKRGVDLSAFTLLPFGGAGAVHAAAVADELGMRRILVPPRPGAFSALGLLCTDVVHDYIRSELRPLAEVPAGHAEQVFAELEAKAREELAAEGLGSADVRCLRELDLRYAGQGYELRTSLDGLYDAELDAASLSAARRRFDERHAQIHGHAAGDRPVEVVSYRLRVRVPVPKYVPRQEPPPATAEPPGAVRKGMRQVHFGAGAATEAAVYERDKLGIGTRIDGPAIVEQFDATTVLPPGWSARVDAYRNLILTREV
ncbi:MAG: hydantoinase/oxoprolinase family protein [Hyphomicrobiaceae bacterium]